MFLRLIDKLLNAGVVQAHCDIPCGIYTTHRAGIAAETVEVMAQKISEAPSDAHAVARYTATKEEWAQICKEELLILWTDYFKEEHLQQFPDLHTTFWKAAKLCSQNKREVNTDAAKALREAVQHISTIFAEAEGEKAKTYRREWL